jgi:hypothetical protein
MIDVGQHIHPLSDFKRTTEFVRPLRAWGRPMLLMLNGRPEIVVLDARSVQKLVDELRDYRAQSGLQNREEPGPATAADRRDDRLTG